MTDVLLLFSSDLERDAAFPDGVPDDITTAITGVGLIDAAVGTARLIAEHKPASILFVGTCGAYRESGFRIEDILVASEVRLGSGDVAQGWMRFPTLLPSELTCDEALSKLVVSRSHSTVWELVMRRGKVSCTLGVTESDELSVALREHDGSDAENLEAFSVLRAAGSIPVAIVLGVTNIVGAGGGTEWRANYRKMMLGVGWLAAASVRRYRSVQKLKISEA